MPHKIGWHINRDKGVLRKIKVWHPCHVNKDKGVLIKKRCQIYAKLVRVKVHLIEMDTKEKKISTPMAHKKVWHVNKYNGVVRKIKLWHLCHVHKDEGVLIKWIDRKLCWPSKGDTSI